MKSGSSTQKDNLCMVNLKLIRLPSPALVVVMMLIHVEYF